MRAGKTNAAPGSKALRRATVAGRGVTAVVVVAVLASGCGIQGKKAEADRIIGSVKKAQAVGTAVGSFSQSTRVIKSDLAGQYGPAGAVGAAGKGATPKRPPASPIFPLTLDLRERQALLTFGALPGSPSAVPAKSAAGAQPPSGPAILFDRWVLYVHAPKSQAASAAAEASAGGNQASLGDPVGPPRDWYKIDFAGLSRQDTGHIQLAQIASMNAVNPALLLQLLAGTLSGGVRRIGPEQIDGVATTHYRVNIDRDKAVHHMSDKDKETVVKLFRTALIKGTVYKNADVWIDDQGRPRRFIVQLPLQLDKANKFMLTCTIDITHYGDQVGIGLPSADQTSEVTSLQQLVSTAVHQQ